MSRRARDSTARRAGRESIQQRRAVLDVCSIKRTAGPVDRLSVPPYLLTHPSDPAARRARLAAAVGVMIGSLLIWGSLAGLNRWVLGFNAWPDRDIASIGRVVMADAPKDSGVRRLERRASARDRRRAGLASRYRQRLAGRRPGAARRVDSAGRAGVPIGGPGGVLAPGGRTRGTPTLTVMGITTPAQRDQGTEPGQRRHRQRRPSRQLGGRQRPEPEQLCRRPRRHRWRRR